MSADSRVRQFFIVRPATDSDRSDGVLVAETHSMSLAVINIRLLPSVAGDRATRSLSLRHRDVDPGM